MFATSCVEVMKVGQLMVMLMLLRVIFFHQGISQWPGTLCGGATASCTSLLCGNMVDGLPPASSFPWTKQKSGAGGFWHMEPALSICQTIFGIWNWRLPYDS